MATAQATGASPMKFFNGPPQPKAAAGAKEVSLDRVVETVSASSRPGDTMLIRLSEKANRPHSAFVMLGEEKTSLRIVHVDRFTGDVLSAKAIADAPPMLQAYAAGASVHMGLIFGLPTQLLAFATCLVLMGLVVTGFWMWWERRPRGRSGLPRRPDVTLPRWLKATIAALCLLLPTAGASFLLILAAELAFARIRRA